jgi:predicted dehydrogenase
MAVEPVLRVGVVGVGTMGINHARILSHLDGATLVGVADPDKQRAKTVARAAGCPAMARLEQLADCGVEAVSIAVPTRLHHDIALACIERGLHILVEKPIASTSTEGHAIVEAARKAGVTLMVGHVERFNPAVQTIKDAIRDEEILSIAITRIGPFPPRKSNLGVVIDLAVHDIDLIRWFTNSEIIDVQSQVSSAITECEDIAMLQFRTASGVLAQINTNWLTPFKARTVHVATRRKYVDGDLLTRQVIERYDFRRDYSYSMRHLAVGQAEPLRAELAAFVHAVRRGVPPAVTGEEGVASLEIAMHCLNGRRSIGSVLETGSRGAGTGGAIHVERPARQPRGAR